MAGIDTVDPAYACVLPVSFATLFWRIAITPNSRLTKTRPLVDWIEGYSRSKQKLPHVQATLRARLVC
jgi:hypothetical protein